jgi:hypothetical protein
LVLAIELENQKSLATQLLKPFIFDYRMVLVAGFVDVDARWRWGSPVSTSLPSPLSFSFFSSHLAADRRCPPRFTYTCAGCSPPTASPVALHQSPPSLATPPLLRARAG